MKRKNLYRLLCGLMAMVLCFGMGAFSASARTLVLGDADMDGGLSLVDVTVIARWCAGWDVHIDENMADVNNDNVVNLKDITLMKRSIVGGWDVVLGQAALTFDATSNGGTFTAGNGFTVDGAAKTVLFGQGYMAADEDGKAWPSNPKKNGCSFKGWYTAPTGGTKITETTLVQMKGDLTVYAQFGGYMETPEIGI